MRAALVEHFRDEAAILIATEAAAEGINLQFCNLVVNYDLPWNPQRIEQRIGRCHRYGQKFDVVVVNFLNKNNAADQRVYELLDEKFRLFNGVFGASDEVLGAVESGVDFEKRIAAIYQKCRTPEQIQFEFDQLQQELETEIAAGQRDAREKLLDNFDQEVVEKVRIQSAGLLDRFNERLWLLTRYLLRTYADFDGRRYSFYLTQQSLPRRDDPSRPVPPGQARRGRQHLPRRPSAGPARAGPGHGAYAIARGGCVSITRDSGKNIAVLTPLVGKTGWLTCSPLERRVHWKPKTSLILAGVTDDRRAVGRNPMPTAVRSFGSRTGRCWLCRTKSATALIEAAGHRQRNSQPRWPPRTANGSTRRWTSSTAGPTTSRTVSSGRFESLKRRFVLPRGKPVKLPRSTRSWRAKGGSRNSKELERTS